jgi:Bacterial regulatory protein, Fis family
MTNNITVIEGKTLFNSDIVAALESARGILSKAAEALGIRRHQLEQALDADRYLHRILMDQINTMIDKAQENVMTAIDAGKYDASIFVLQTLGKEKGYSTKSELTLTKIERPMEDMSIEELEAHMVELSKQAGFEIKFPSDNNEAQAQLEEYKKGFEAERQRQLIER